TNRLQHPPVRSVLADRELLACLRSPRGVKPKRPLGLNTVPNRGLPSGQAWRARQLFEVPFTHARRRPAPAAHGASILERALPRARLRIDGNLLRGKRRAGGNEPAPSKESGSEDRHQESLDIKMTLDVE